MIRRNSLSIFKNDSKPLNEESKEISKNLKRRKMKLITKHLLQSPIIAAGLVVVLACLISAGVIEIYLRAFLPHNSSSNLSFPADTCCNTKDSVKSDLDLNSKTADTDASIPRSNTDASIFDNSVAGILGSIDDLEVIVEEDVCIDGTEEQVIYLDIAEITGNFSEASSQDTSSLSKTSAIMNK